jgi:hypothetical protein
MGEKRYTPEQVIGKLREAEAALARGISTSGGPHAAEGVKQAVAGATRRIAPAQEWLT